MSTPVSPESACDGQKEQNGASAAGESGNEGADLRKTLRDVRLARETQALEALLREEESRLRRSRSQRRRRLREREQATEEAIRFAGDITTPFGLLAATDDFMRRFAAGRISYRRFDAMVKTLKLIARERIECPSRLLRLPRLPSVSVGSVIEADLRSRSPRKAELRRLRQRVEGSE